MYDVTGSWNFNFSSFQFNFSRVLLQNYLANFGHSSVDLCAVAYNAFKQAICTSVLATFNILNFDSERPEKRKYTIVYTRTLILVCCPKAKLTVENQSIMKHVC